MLTLEVFYRRVVLFGSIRLIDAFGRGTSRTAPLIQS